MSDTGESHPRCCRCDKRKPDLALGFTVRMLVGLAVRLVVACTFGWFNR